MARRGFTLIELLIVMIIIALLAALLLPALVKAICAAKETKAQNLITEIENACKMYERDHNAYPPGQLSTPFNSGTAAFALAQLGPKKQPYIEFQQGDVTVFPMTTGSNVVNPVDPSDQIHYRNNRSSPPPAAVPVALQNKWGVDLWTRNCDSTDTGINNWRAPN